MIRHKSIKRRGFTLLEVIVAMVILAIVATLGLSGIGGAIRINRYSQDRTILQEKAANMMEKIIANSQSMKNHQEMITYLTTGEPLEMPLTLENQTTLRTEATWVTANGFEVILSWGGFVDSDPLSQLFSFEISKNGIRYETIGSFQFKAIEGGS
ncbi:MAG: prepilin-type N-terminal cleavage/methylation domain-containing protein [Erysipelothrix sp.]|nr:prepilin-type N-terminal cleavage/methylation domain-containing protein [Erysipelothrix sp.]